MLPKESNEDVRFERFTEIPARRVGTGALSEHIVVRGDEDDGGRIALGGEKILKIEAAQPAEMDVEHDAIGLARDVAFQKLLG